MPPKNQSSRATFGTLVPHPSLPAKPVTEGGTPTQAGTSFPYAQPFPNNMMTTPQMMYNPAAFAMPNAFGPQAAYFAGQIPQWNPQTALQQAIFQQPMYSVPTHTNEGYSYSSTWIQQQMSGQVGSSSSSVSDQAGPSAKPGNEDASPPAKRPRNNGTARPVATASSDAKPTIKSNHGKTSAFVPTRTKIPLRKGQDEASQGFWRNCSQSGCSYVGPDKEVQVHEEDRHLIYKNPPKKSEEEEDAARSFGYVYFAVQ